MQPKTPGWLWDIADSAQFISDELDGATFEEYQRDRRLRLAVERSFEIIGEAARRMANQDPATAALLPELAQLISFRNVLAHGYDTIDDEKVWSIIQHSLPVLQAEVDALLREAGAE
jgi:uncharacterized protein with HEPN domain